MNNDVRIHSCTGTSLSAAVHRKIGLYASEIVCTIYSGTLSRSGSANALELASIAARKALEQLRELPQARERGWP